MLTDFIDPKKITYLPNTAGCFTGQEAIRTLRLAREAGGWDLVKPEVLGQAKTLYPDMVETLRATEHLIKGRSEEHTSALQPLMRISYAAFCLEKKRTHPTTTHHTSIISPLPPSAHKNP